MSTEKILKESLGCNKDDLTLQWNNLTYSVKNSKNESEKYILNNVSGSIKSKTLTAILGPSGAGKTTLLEAISCRTKIQGIVSINGYFMTNTFMKTISSFVAQYNATFDALNVQEYLYFVCTMKMYKLLNSQERKLRVSDIIYEFGLEKCRGTQICHLSGGEKRKVHLCAELLSDPAIIFCDEPTTGLDSYNAQQIITILKEQASNGKIVIISIHQPPSNLIQYFDNFILLSLGSIILNGDQALVTSFFDKMNIKCPAACNIAEFYIKQISVVPGLEEECITKISNIRKTFLENQQNQNNLNPWLKSIQFTEILKCPYYIQFLWLFWRECVVMKRKIFQELIIVLCLSITGLIIGLFYSSVKLTINNVQDIKGYMYYLVSELLFTGTYCVLDTFPREIPIFKSEKDLYSSSIYYLVKVFSKFHHMIIWPFCYLSILYYFAPFNMDIYIYLKIWFIISIALITAEAYGFMFSSIFENVKYIELIMVPMDVFFLLTSGVFVKIDTIPYIFTWSKYMSSFFYASDAVSILYWNKFYKSYSSNMTTWSNTTFEYQNYVHRNYYWDLYCLIILATIMHFIGCCTLIQRKKKFYKA